MNNAYLIEKLGSLTFVLGAALLCSPLQLLNLLIVMGHGHFILAYLYQHKAGKISSAYILRYIILFAGLWAVFAYTLSIEWLVVIAGTQFLMHFLQDEIYLFRQQHSFFTTIEIALLCVLYFGVLHTQIFPDSTINTYTVPLAIVLATLYIALAYIRDYTPRMPSHPILLGMMLLIGIEAFSISIPAEYLLGSVIIFHYCEWYIHYYLKLQDNQKALRQYLKNVVLVNSGVLLLFLTYVFLFNRTGVLDILFTVFWFYLWTLMHTLTSLRKQDMRAAFSWPR